MNTADIKMPPKVKSFERFLSSKDIPFTLEVDETDASLLYIFRSVDRGWWEDTIRTAFYENKLVKSRPVKILLSMGYGFHTETFELRGTLKEHKEAWIRHAPRGDQ